MNRFEKTLETAKRNYRSYADANNTNISSLAFGSAGHMSRGARNRLTSMVDVRHNKSIAIEYREIMLLCSQFKMHYAGCWELADEILNKCSQAKVYSDDVDYYSAERSTRCKEKTEAIINFINRYGKANDKKILIPKFKLTNS